MKITSLLSSGVLEFNDLGNVMKGVSPVIRDIKLNPGQSKYLLETSEVLLSAQSGDIARYKAAGKISVNDLLTIGAGASVVLTHNFGFLPKVAMALVSGVTHVSFDASWVTITHNLNFTTTTLRNTTGGPLTIDVRLS